MKQVLSCPTKQTVVLVLDRAICFCVDSSGLPSGAEQTGTEEAFSFGSWRGENPPDTHPVRCWGSGPKPEQGQCPWRACESD